MARRATAARRVAAAVQRRAVRVARAPPAAPPPAASAAPPPAAPAAPAPAASGALLHGTLAITTNAAGAEDTQISIVLTAQGNACTLSCGSLTQCMPTGGSPYCANTVTDNANCGACGHACGATEICNGGSCT